MLQSFMIFRVLAQIIYSIFILMEALLSLRFILKLINVKPVAKIIIWLYNVTTPMLSAFIGIFPNDPVKLLGFSIELTTLLVLFILSICSYALYEIIKAYTPWQNT